MRSFETCLRFVLPAVACLVLAGCQSMPFGWQAEDPDAPESPATGVSLESAIDLLQDGEEGAAERMLESIIEERPDDVTARLLLAQIRRQPRDLLGTQFEEVEVREGESLSAIAERTIGNGLLFYSLAKLNQIEVPRLLSPGQRLRVPVDGREQSSPEAATGREAEASTASSPEESDPNRVARALIEQKQFSQAYSLLLDAARAGQLDRSGRVHLAESAVQLARAACRKDDPRGGERYLDQAAPWLGPLSEEGDFARQRAHVGAQLKLGEAEAFMARGDQAEAFSALMAAREMSGELARSHGARLTRLETELAEHFHDQALSAWRDQQVDRSVELWDRVVQIDPDFEPAIRYLDRARRAQRELKALENG